MNKTQVMSTLTRTSQEKALVDESKSTGESSCQQFKGSLAALEPILEHVESGNVCQVDFVDKVSQYQTEFIRLKSVLVPQVLREFFIRLSALQLVPNANLLCSTV